MHILQIKLLVVFFYIHIYILGGFGESKRRTFKPSTSLCSCFHDLPSGLVCHWMLRWKQSIQVICTGWNPVSRCDVCFSLLSSCLALEYRVLSNILTAAGLPALLVKTISFHEAHFFMYWECSCLLCTVGFFCFLQLNIWKGVSHLYLLTSERTSPINLLKPDNKWQEPATGKTKSGWMPGCLLWTIDCRFIHQLLWFSLACWAANWQLIPFLSTNLCWYYAIK